MSEWNTNPVPDPWIGQRIDRYVIRRQLAEGGMGAVYLATHETLENTRKVIKILLPGYARSPMVRDRFEREAQAVSRLRHKNIVTIDDFGRLPDGQLFLMMPFLEGRSLDSYLRDHRRFTEHRALHIMVQVLGALQHMHDVGVIHRDIKPSNIFIVADDDNPYRVVLIDLGIAKTLSEPEHVTRTGATMGTPAYMAVEQYEDTSSVSPLADLYSAAIVAWELVTGRLPWGMHTAPVLYTKQKHDQPPRPPEMSAAWYDILLSALAVRPEDRPKSARALAVALASAVSAIPPHVPSGAEILAKLAKPFVQNVPPSEETVRNGSHVDRVAPLVWPPRETQMSDTSPQDAAVPPTEPPPGNPLPGPPTKTAPGRPIQPHPQPQPAYTTLTGSAGVTTAPSTNRSWRTAAAIGLVAGVVGVVAFVITQRGLSTPHSAAQPVASGIAPSDAGPYARSVDARPVDAWPIDARSEPDARVASDEASEPPLDHAKQPAPNNKHSMSPANPHSRDKAFDPNAIGGDE